MNKLFNFRNKKKGFSIGEVLISVFILGVTMVTITQLFVVSLKNFAETRDSIIASMLAQEGIELVKNIRDNNWVNNNSSFLNLATPGALNFYCIIDTELNTCDSVNVSSPSFSNDITLYYNSTKNLYVDSLSVNGSTSITKFKRIVVIQRLPDNILLKVFVLWGPLNVNCDSVADKCVKVSSRLTKWGE